MGRVPERDPIATPNNRDNETLCNLFSDMTKNSPLFFSHVPSLRAVNHVHSQPIVMGRLAGLRLRYALNIQGVLVRVIAHHVMSEGRNVNPRQSPDKRSLKPDNIRMRASAISTRLLVAIALSADKRRIADPR